MWHNLEVSHQRYMSHLGERGRLVVPAPARRRLKLDSGDLVVIDVDDDTLVVRKAAEVAHGLRGYLRDFEPSRDLAGELIAERRAEAEAESDAGTAASR
jgi:AbrB family looped-hinge helix DNA binding protein